VNTLEDLLAYKKICSGFLFEQGCLMFVELGVPY
jgi:hypothetical protein